MSKLYHNTPRKDHVAPLLAPRMVPTRKHRDPIAYGRMSGADLRAVRVYHRLSQTQLAAILCCSRASVSRWEIGRDVIPVEIHPAIELLQSPKDRLGNPVMAAGLAMVNLKTNEIIRLF